MVMVKPDALPLCLLLLFLSTSLLCFLLRPTSRKTSFTTVATSATTAPSHLVFGVAAASKSFRYRYRYLNLWASASKGEDGDNLHGFVFLDSFPQYPLPNASLPFRLLLSSDSSHLPFTHPRGFRSAVRVSRIIKDLVSVVTAGIPSARWLVLGDDDTVFFPENLAAVLAKYDWRDWWYVGGSSEMVEQNALYSFDMAFGGGGFAVSMPLARAVAEVIDGCLQRYGHLYGSDERVFACVSELGVGMTRERGFHQVDLRGNIFGFLSAHPLAPLLSLHHLDYVEPIFPGVSQMDALKRLFQAAKVDQGRILQQTVCYDHQKSWTFSVSWGYSVQAFEGNQLLLDLLAPKRTFMPWRRKSSSNTNQYMFETREFPKDPCKQPTIYYFDGVHRDGDGIWSIYNRHDTTNCQSSNTSLQNLKQIKVLSQKLDLRREQKHAPRRHCCDTSRSISTDDEALVINIRKCQGMESIAMHI